MTTRHEHNPEQLLDDLRHYLERFIAYPTPETTVAHCLWIAHSHLIEEFENTPRLAFLSPEPGSGKSRALELTEALVPRPELTVNNTVAYIFRVISTEEGKPTLLLDEADAIFSAKKADGNEDLRGLLNSGYRKGAFVGRATTKGREIVVEKFPSYCAVAFAGLHRLPDTLMTRSVVVNMKKRRPDQSVEAYRPRDQRQATEALKARLEAFADSIRDTIGAYRPELPETISDRDADLWECLIAIADKVGGKWPSLARDAAVYLVAQSKNRPVTLGVRLLGDIREVLGDDDRISTHDLLERLHELESAPWGNMRGEPIDARYLARNLAEYEIKSNTVRFGDTPLKGYLKSDFFDAWLRYLPEAESAEKCCESCGSKLHPAVIADGGTTCPSCPLVTPVTVVTLSER